MKKYLKFLFVIVLAITVTGCGNADPGESLENSGVLESVPTTPEQPGNSLVPYEQELEIYFSCHNRDYDIYFGESCAPFLSFWILSRDALDMEDIQVDIPIQNGYSIFRAECYDEDLGHLLSEKEDDPIDTYFTFMPYLYWCYWGTQWSEIYEDPDAATIRTKEGEEFLLKEVYSLLKADDLPQFHVYHVNILLEETVGGEEVFREIDLTIGGETYHLNIGEIRLHEDPPLNYPCDLGIDESGGITSQTIIVYGTPPMLYNDGVDQLFPAFDFTVPYDMELLDLYLLDSEMEILDIRLLVNSDNGNSMDIYWNTDDPIELAAGDRVQIYVYYRDERQKMLDYSAKAWVAMDYACQKGFYSAFSECTLQREMNLYELYAIVFDGVDMESYYRDYYFPKNESWRQDYAS